MNKNAIIKTKPQKIALADGLRYENHSIFSHFTIPKESNGVGMYTISLLDGSVSKV